MARALWLPAAFDTFGVNYRTVSGWETRGENVFNPIGVMNHHTADSTPTSSALNLILQGRPDLPGPLAQIYLDWDGVAYIVASGEANHAGMGVNVVRQRALANLAPKGDAAAIYGGGSDDYGGNDYWIGIEVQHPGDSTPHPQAQLDTLIKVNAAICAHQGWSHNRCIHHREHTSRKIDMSWRGDLRGLVRQAMEMNNMADNPTFKGAQDIGAQVGVDTDLLVAWQRALDAGVATVNTNPDDISTAEQTMAYLDRYTSKVVGPLVAKLNARIDELEAAQGGGTVGGLKRGDTVKLT
jgi:hypothetical protein